MQAALIAAGQGQRLRAAGWALVKPLVPVAGRPLLEYVLRSVCAAGAKRIAAVVNGKGRPVELYCHRYWPQIHFDFVYRDTPSSLESLFALETVLAKGRFLLTMADTLVPPLAMRRFCTTALQGPPGALFLAVTSFVDDEKPLWVEFDTKCRVTRMGVAASGSGWITAGFYFLPTTIFEYAKAARVAGLDALRTFLAWLLEEGFEVRAVPVGKCVDVDRPADLQVAAEFVRQEYSRHA